MATERETFPLETPVKIKNQSVQGVINKRIKPKAKGGLSPNKILDKIQAKMGVQRKFMARLVHVNLTCCKLLRKSFNGTSQKSPRSIQVKKGETRALAIPSSDSIRPNISPVATAISNKRGSSLSSIFKIFLLSW
jgi:hypothetical protein